MGVEVVVPGICRGRCVVESRKQNQRESQHRERENRAGSNPLASLKRPAAD